MGPLVYLHSALLGHTEQIQLSMSPQAGKELRRANTEQFNKLTPRDKDDLMTAWLTIH